MLNWLKRKLWLLYAMLYAWRTGRKVTITAVAAADDDKLMASFITYKIRVETPSMVAEELISGVASSSKPIPEYLLACKLADDVCVRKLLPTTPIFVRVAGKNLATFSQKR